MFGRVRICIGLLKFLLLAAKKFPKILIFKALHKRGTRPTFCTWQTFFVVL